MGDNKIPEWALVIIAISLIFLLKGFFGMFAVIGVGGIPVQEKAFTFDGISGVAQSPYFGSISSNTLAMQEFIDLGMSPYARHSICGDNDGRISISNDVSGGSQLSMSSSMSGSRGCGGANNYIKTLITIPKGSLTISCSLSSSESNNEQSISTCNVGNLFSLTSNWDKVCQRAASCNGKTGADLSQCLIGANFNEGSWASLCNSPKSKTSTISINHPTEVEIMVTSTVGNTGGASASMTLSFEKEPEVVPSTYYRFENNLCNEIDLLPEAVTTNDYTTLVGCQTNIVVPAPTCTADKCTGTTYFQCIGGEFVNKGLVNGKCGYTTPSPICITGATKCESKNYFVCESQNWNNKGLVNGRCGYSSTPTVEEIGLETIIFNIGEFEIKLWMLIAAGLGAVLLLGGKRR